MRIRIICLLICLVLVPANAPAQAGGKVALVMKALSNPFFLKMEAGARKYANAHDIPLEVFGMEKETEIERQIGIVDSLISNRYAAIIIAPADSKKLVPICKKAADRGITVINIDNPFHRETLNRHGISISFVGSDNKAGADMVGNYIKRKLEAKGSAIIIEGIRGVENAELRKKGFIEGLTSGSKIRILAMESANWHRYEAFSAISELLKKYKKTDAVLCANDQMALGVLQSLDIFGLAGQVWVSGYDNVEEVRNEMRKGYIHATVEQHPELMGQLGVELAVRALSGEKIPDHTATPLDLITYESFDKKIAFSVPDIKNPFFDALVHAAGEAANLFGIRLLIADAENSDAKQVVDIQNFVQENADLIVITPTNTDAVVPAMEIANAAGIKIVTADRKTSREDIVLSHIASDNVAGGRMAGEFIAKQLNGAGKILAIEGIPGTSAACDRCAGFDEVIAKHPNLKITHREVALFDRDKAREFTKQLLKKGCSFDAIFAHNDSMILGAIEAFESSEIEMLPITVGFDAIPQALESIRQKKLTATVAQNPEKMGRLIIQNAVKIFRGEELPKVTLVELKIEN
jgi:ABC-type sugar transport system substrate-binding protein